MIAIDEERLRRIRVDHPVTVEEIPAAAADDDAPAEECPEIIISSDQAGTVDAAESALVAAGGIYVRARTLVQVVRDVSESHGLAYPDGSPVIARIGRERLRELLGRAATWISIRRTQEGDERREVQCPPWVAATLEQRGQWRLPWLDAISDAPILRPDGTLVDVPGYDRATRTIYDPGAMRYPAIPSRPGRDDARAAYAVLVEPMCDVPYVADSDRAAWASLVLTLLARPAISGVTPLYLVRAPVPGAGKGLALDVAAIIATGRPSPKRPPATSDDELRKALLAYAIESPALVAIDNVDGVLGSPTLAMVLTAGTLSDRLLGVSESRTVSVRYVLAATGNSVQLRGDVGRRTVPIDIDPRVEHPEDRTDWRYPDLLGHVRRSRPRLVAAALTMLRSYIVAGQPSHGQPHMGSYEAWDTLIRGAVVWASGVDPLGGRERIRQDGDEDLERLRALLTTWHAAVQSTPITVAELVRRAGDAGDLHDALAACCRGGIDTRQLGYALRRMRRRVCAGLQLDRGTTVRGSITWQVVEVEP